MNTKQTSPWIESEAVCRLNERFMGEFENSRLVIVRDPEAGRVVQRPSDAVMDVLLSQPLSVRVEFTIRPRPFRCGGVRIT